MAREYHFYIIDKEFGDSYYYDAFFVNAAEALRFIHENQAVGNVVDTQCIDFITSHYIDWDRGCID